MKDTFTKCRVCGFDCSPFFPWGVAGTTPSYSICPNCGVEFGYEDATLTGIQRYREKHLDTLSPPKCGVEMIRDAKGNQGWWEKWANFSQLNIDKDLDVLDRPFANPTYAPQFTFDIALEIRRLILRRYSRGDPIRELAQHIPGLLDAWERSNRLSADICLQNNIAKCRDWTFDLADLNHYIWCFWLVGLALLLEIPDDQWQRLLVLVDGEGQDALLDRVIATRQPNRIIANKLLHNAPYLRLLKAMNAPKAQQAEWLKAFVDHWYAELDRPKKRGSDPTYYRPYWYDYGDTNFEGGSYFGRWCIEAAVAAKVFGIDDRLCLAYEHYPGDLLRPDGPSTHPVRLEPKPRFFGRFFKKKSS